jgi:hypothetical protein
VVGEEVVHQWLELKEKVAKRLGFARNLHRTLHQPHLSDGIEVRSTFILSAEHNLKMPSQLKND